MSYIIKKTNPFVSSKLTEKGREKIAKGQLNFRYWGVGDSEINYGFEEIRDANPDETSLQNKSYILKPVERQPNIKYFVTKGAEASPYNALKDGEVKAVKANLSNLAKERGFFDENKLIKTNVPYVLNSGTVDSSHFGGTNNVTLVAGLTINNYILFKMSNVEPAQYLWYKIIGVSGSTYTLDRNLPNLTSPVSGEYFEYASGHLFENGMANDTTTPYWDVNTLSFDTHTETPVEDVPFWNMNNIWSENVIGLVTDTGEEFYKYGSNDMIGTRSPFLCYVDTIAPNEIQLQDVCYDASQPQTVDNKDNHNRAISVIHYTNNQISSRYGEYFHIEVDKNVEIEIPTMMYHRRNDGGTGMTFISDGSEKNTIKNSNITYYDLIEDPNMVKGDPKIVGKVLPDYHVIVFDDEEIVAAMTYKSGRNWTLPGLKTNLTNSNSGGGLVKEDESIFITYVLEDSTNGIAYNLPCQDYGKISNTGSSSKDINFSIDDVDGFRHMQSTPGKGFDADNLKILYQIVGENGRPKSDAWKEVDGFSLTDLKANNTQKLTKDNATTIYKINNKLNLPDNGDEDNLQFGDERFFYGNIRTHIGASVFKTVFDVKISANEFNYTTNPTRRIEESIDTPEIRVSEVGIYDNERNLVFIAKIAEPLKLINGNTVNIEFSMDF